MNPLGNGNLGGGLPQGLQQNIYQAKQLMNMFNGNPGQVIQNNPTLNQIMQIYKGQDLKSVFYNLAQQKGVDPEAILNELRK